MMNRHSSLQKLKLSQVLFPSVLKNTDSLFGFQISFQETYFSLSRNKAVLCGYLDGLRRILLKHCAVNCFLPALFVQWARALSLMTDDGQSWNAVPSSSKKTGSIKEPEPMRKNDA
jgi:hypothetical protein